MVVAEVRNQCGYLTFQFRVLSSYSSRQEGVGLGILSFAEACEQVYHKQQHLKVNDSIYSTLKTHKIYPRSICVVFSIQTRKLRVQYVTTVLYWGEQSFLQYCISILCNSIYNMNTLARRQFLKWLSHFPVYINNKYQLIKIVCKELNSTF